MYVGQLKVNDNAPVNDALFVNGGEKLISVLCYDLLYSQTHFLTWSCWELEQYTYGLQDFGKQTVFLFLVLILLIKEIFVFHRGFTWIRHATGPLWVQPIRPSSKDQSSYSPSFCPGKTRDNPSWILYIELIIGSACLPLHRFLIQNPFCTQLSLSCVKATSNSDLKGQSRWIFRPLLRLRKEITE